MCPAHCSQAFHSSYWSTYRKGNLYFPKETSPFVILHLHSPCTPNHFPLQLPASLPLPQPSAAENGHGWFTSSSGWSKTPLHLPTQTPYFAWGGVGVMGMWLLFALRTHPIAQATSSMHRACAQPVQEGRASKFQSYVTVNQSKQSSAKGNISGLSQPLRLHCSNFLVTLVTLCTGETVFSAWPPRFCF